MMIKFVFFGACIALSATQYNPAQTNQYLPPRPTGYNYPSPARTVPVTVRPPAPRPPAPRPPAPQLPRPVQQDNHVHVPGTPFNFQYQVNDQPTRNDYSHKAASDGDVVRGDYRVALPDGRTQVVKYVADWKTGYHADVSYEGQARYPDQPTGPANRFSGYQY